MHLPKPHLALPVPSSDRLAHVVAYAILAFLYWRFAETLQQPLSGRFVWVAWVTLASYAALDEWLQQFVGRSTDLLDWLCDVAGATAVLAFLEWRRRCYLVAAPNRKPPVEPKPGGR